MLESYHKLQPKSKTVPEYKDALQLIWFALPRRERYWQRSERLPQVTAGIMWQPTVDILNNVIIHNRH